MLSLFGSRSTRYGLRTYLFLLPYRDLYQSSTALHQEGNEDKETARPHRVNILRSIPINDQELVDRDSASVKFQASKLIDRIDKGTSSRCTT